MKVRHRNPSNGGNALSKIVDGPANFLDDLRLQIDGEKGANHDYSKRVSRSQLSAACEVPRMTRSRSPWNWNRRASWLFRCARLIHTVPTGFSAVPPLGHA